MKSRLQYTGRNIFWGYISSFITILLSFVSRTVFIKTIGIDYLGINGLFTSVLGILSLTELGIGTAMNYSLYKPVAENDTEQIKSLMGLYKKAYRWVSLTVTVLGLLILPFLNLFVKGAEGIGHLKLYYLIFLFNTVSSYFVSYKYSLVNADQKNYIITNIHTISNIITNVLQIVSLFICGNYILYLIIQAAVQLSQKIYASIYIDLKYPFLKDKQVKPLESSEKNRIVKDVKALVIHKIGEISVNQTDNLIISAFINVTTVGLVSNYMLITSTVNTFVNIAFNGTIGSLGNLFASNDREKQYKVFKTMDFVGFWIFCFSSIAIFSLIQPFITLMWGETYTLPLSVVILYVLNNYIVGQRITVNNVKVSGGIFEQDKFFALYQSVINLVVSIVLAKYIGLIGVYIGTIVSGMVPTLFRPHIVYRDLLKRKSRGYYVTFFVRIFFTIALAAINYMFVSFIMSKITIGRFIAATIFTAIIPNLFIFVISYKNEEFRYVLSILIGLISKIRKGKSNG